MVDIIYLALRSLWHRRVPTLLTVAAIAISVALFAGVNKTRTATKDAFSGAISKVDLIVGPRSGNVSLLLYSVFHVGSPSHLIPISAMNRVRAMDGVDWVVPFNLGDGFRGYSVVGTTPEFFGRYKYGFGESIRFHSGQSFAANAEVVLGFEVANKFDLKVGDKVVLSHGHTEDGDGFQKHDDHPFQVTGVLAVTGSPVDKSVFVDMRGLAAIHEVPVSGHDDAHADDDHHEHAHDDHGHEHDEDVASTMISGFFLGAKDRSRSLSLQREINTSTQDALLAIMPGLTMAELWKSLSMFETSLSVISLSVVVSGLLGLFVSLYILSGQRRREMTVLRAVGAGPATILGLLAGEAVFLVLLGIVSGYGIMIGGLGILNPWIERRFSVTINLSFVTSDDIYFCAAMLVMGCVAGVIASVGSYRAAMQDGLGSRF